MSSSCSQISCLCHPFKYSLVLFPCLEYPRTVNTQINPSTNTCSPFAQSLEASDSFSYIGLQTPYKSRAALPRDEITRT